MQQDIPITALADSSLSRALSDLSSSLESLQDIDSVRQPAREKISAYRSTSPDDNTVRILLSFIRYLPDDGCRVLCSLINDDECDLKALALHLENAVLWKMRAVSRTPSVSQSPFGPADDASLEMSGQSVSRTEQSALKKACLKRDGYRCMVTGLYDAESRDQFPDVSNDEFIECCGHTHASHIIPFRLGHYDKNNSTQEKEIANMWTTIIAMFPSLNDVLGPKNLSDINHPRNVMTVHESLNTDFGRLQIALEPTGGENENEYEFIFFSHKVNGHLLRYIPKDRDRRIVRFTKSEDEETELPSPVLLSVHATIARIFHAAGMGEKAEDIQRDFETLKVLSNMSPEVADHLAKCLAVLAVG